MAEHQFSLTINGRERPVAIVGLGYVGLMTLATPWRSSGAQKLCGTPVLRTGEDLAD